MKKSNKCAPLIGIYVLTMMIIFNITNVQIVTRTNKVTNLNLDKHLENRFVFVGEVIPAKAEVAVIKQPIVKDDYGVVDTSAASVLTSYTASISHYGNDCDGCSGRTAYGYDIKERITYQDATYGNVRVFAGDRSYPFGTIVRLTYTSGETVVGMVLDRGSGIGFGRKYQFDVLTENEAKSYQLGVQRNVVVDILRFGF